jgi:hypothetical protein
MKTIIRKLAAVLPLYTLAICGLLALHQQALAQYYPGDLQPGQVLGNNASSPAPAAAISMFGAVAAPGGAQLYAAPTAQGTGSCLSAANACTLPTACSFRSQVTTFISGGFNINLATGTYNTANADSALCSIYGNAGGSSSALTSLIGNVVSGSCISQTAVILAVPNNSTGLLIKDGGEAVLNCVEITLGSNAIGIQDSGQSAVVDYDNVTWGSAGSNSVDVSGSYGAYVNLTSGGETIIGNRSFHWLLSGNAVLNAGGLTALTGTPAFAGAFLSASGNNYIFLATWTFSGSATGTRATLNGPGYMVTAGAAACNSIFPGGGGCAFSNGFQDNAGEGAVLPNPTPSTLGGIKSYAAVSHQWINQISTSGAPSSTQPAFSDLSGAATNAQMPVGGAGTIKGSLNGTSEVDLTGAQGASVLGVGMMRQTITVNFGVTGDNAIPIVLWPGDAEVQFNRVLISQCGGSLSGAAFGMNTAPSGGGAQILPSGTAATLTSNTANTNNNMQQLTSFNNIGSEAYTPSSGQVQFNVGTAVATNPTNCKVTAEYFSLP